MNQERDNSRKRIQLEYRAESDELRVGRLWLAVGLVIVGAMIFGLRKLETWPYRPPHDMTTFLGSRELAFGGAAMVLLAMVWCPLLVKLFLSFRPHRRDAWNRMPRTGCPRCVLSFLPRRAGM
jgi:hypothetical protein